MKHEPKDDRDYLRQVVFDGYCLRTWETDERDDRGRNYIGYELIGTDGTVLFEDTDFSPSPAYAIDSDRALRSIIFFLTLRPGDTDDEYFKNYTPVQLAWAEEHGEELGLWADEDIIEGSDSFQFENIDDWTPPPPDDETDEEQQEREREEAAAFRRYWGDDAITIDKPDPAYSRNDPKGWCGDPSRGAAMGRFDKRGDPDFAGVLTLRAVQLDGDYDVNGTYWGGGGEQLWWYSNEDGSIDAMVRARSRDYAKEAIADRYPNARFNR